ncbi:MAG: hypothetical protein ACRCYU_21635 [Nocardioides sp.]
MVKVIQIRGVPDHVHAVLVNAARARGLSLTKYLREELAYAAARVEIVRDNAVVIRRTQRVVGGQVAREMTRRPVVEEPDG